MGDITDLYSTVSRTRVSPQKSYVASYALTSSYADTGATLSVANGQFYAVLLFIPASGGASAGTFSGQLYQGATIMQTFTSTININSNGYAASQIFQNTSGSTQTVKLQAKLVTAGVTVTDIQLISGSFLYSIPNNGSTILPINAYINNLEMVGASIPNNQAESEVGVLGLSQSAFITAASLVIGLNIVVSGINCTSSALSLTTFSANSFAAFDFDGKTLAL